MVLGLRSIYVPRRMVPSTFHFDCAEKEKCERRKFILVRGCERKNALGGWFLD
jgi:hypothetical protein